MTVLENFYAIRLAKRGARHLRFMQALMDEPDLDSPRAEFNYATKRLEEHKRECKGCTF